MGAQRALEVLRARRNARRLAARGGRAVAGDWHGWIVALHVAWLAGAAGEAFLAGARLGAWTVPLLLVFLTGQGLRRWAMHALGDRWTTRVWIVPGEARVARGPYRWMRHPNYVGVALELAALPLAFGLWRTAIVASAVNAALLAARIRVEERALAGAETADAA